MSRPYRMDSARNRAAAKLANAALRLAHPRYRAFVRGSIEYGMRAALRDNLEGRRPPADWRAPGASDPFPRVKGGAA